MARTRGRSKRGTRCRASVPFSHWNTTTLVAGLGADGVVAPMTLSGAMNGEMFKGYVEKMLCPTLKPGSIVFMDNLAAHKVSGVREALEAVGAKLIADTGKHFVQRFSELGPALRAAQRIDVGLNVSDVEAFAQGCQQEYQLGVHQP